MVSCPETSIIFLLMMMLLLLLTTLLFCLFLHCFLMFLHTTHKSGLRN
ncbi:hypothetical protein LINPERPRIM_LOCUS31445 [Linum perenne]